MRTRENIHVTITEQKYNSDDVGLYRDDGLSVFRNVIGQKAEKHKKLIQNFFKDKGLQIIIKCNPKIVDYLDVTLNLDDGTYCPLINLMVKHFTSIRIRPPSANYQENHKSTEERSSRLTSTIRILRAASKTMRI